MECADMNIFESYCQLAVRISLNQEINLIGSGVLFVRNEGNDALVLTAYHVISDLLEQKNQQNSSHSNGSLLLHFNLHDTEQAKCITISLADSDRFYSHEQALYIHDDNVPEDDRCEYDAAIIRIPYQDWMKNLPHFTIAEGNQGEKQIGWGYPKSQLIEGVSGRSVRKGIITDTNPENWYVKYQYAPNTVGVGATRQSINEGFSGSGIFQENDSGLVLSGVISSGAGNNDAGAEMKLARSRLFQDIMKANGWYTEDIPNIDSIRYTDDPDYMDKWNKSASLFTQNTRLSLKNLYIFPDFRYRRDPQSVRRTGAELEKKLLSAIKTPENDDHKRMYVVVGNAGAGKSSLLRYLWHHPDLVSERICYISCRNYSDSFSENARSEALVKLLFSKIKDVYPTLDSNTSVFLDGLDELSLSREKVHRFLTELDKELNRTKIVRSIIISCRINYVSALNKLYISSVVLCPFSKKQIKIYADKLGCDLSVNAISDEMEKIYGLPLILQIALASGLKLEEKSTLAKVYYKLFNPDDGIFTYRISCRLEENQKIYSYENEPAHKTTWELAKDICDVNEALAFWMFENNPSEITCKKDIVDNIIKEESANLSEQQLLIGSFYQELVEGNEDIKFIHKSIYEYFTAQFLFSKLKYLFGDICKYNEKEFSENVENCVTQFYKIAILFRKGKMSELTSFFLEKILEDYDKSIQRIYARRRLSNWEKLMELAMEKGFLHAENISIIFSDRIRQEYNIFWNLLAITQILYKRSGFLRKKDMHISKRIFENNENIVKRLPDYMILPRDNQNLRLDFSYCCMDNICLLKDNLMDCTLSYCSMKNAILRKMFLSSAKMEGAVLSGADLYMANFEGTNLKEAKLENADLEKCNLSDASMVGAHFENANLKYANLTEANMRGAHLAGADLRGAILKRANLTDTDLNGCKMQGASFEDSQTNSIWEFDFKLAEFRNLLIGGKSYSYSEVIKKQKAMNDEINAEDNSNVFEE